MAIVMSRTDDLDKSTPATQVTFGFDGQCYVLDLGEANKGKLAAALQRFITVAFQYGAMPAAPAAPQDAEMVIAPVPVTANGHQTLTAKPAAAAARRRRARPNAKVPAQTKAEPANGAVPHSVIRQWANSNGYSVTPRGRIPTLVLDAYGSAHA